MFSRVRNIPFVSSHACSKNLHDNVWSARTSIDISWRRFLFFFQKWRKNEICQDGWKKRPVKPNQTNLCRTYQFLTWEYTIHERDIVWCYVWWAGYENHSCSHVFNVHSPPIRIYSHKRQWITKSKKTTNTMCDLSSHPIHPIHYPSLTA